MNTIYQIIDFILPFEWLNYQFMKNAFLGILIITPLFGLVGTMIVNNKMAFFSDALGHSALTGMAFGVLLKVANMNIAMTVFAVFFAIVLNILKRKQTLSTDTVISVFSSFSLSIGLVILSRGGNFAKYSNLLVGDILSITEKELKLLIFILLGTLVFWFLCFNKLQAASIHRMLANSKGIPCTLLEDLFSILIALIVMFSIQWVGILIINALIILPAAASRNIASNMREYHMFSILIAIFSGVLGLMVSYYMNTATGPTIVIVASFLFFITFMVRNRRY